MAFTATKEQHEKLDALRSRMRALDAAAICYSGGVDSTLLLAIAAQELGERAFAITATSPLFPARETDEAMQLCARFGVTQVFVEHDPALVEGFCENPRNRCYLCKRDLFARLQAAADEHAHTAGLLAPDASCALLEGSNASDLGDYRPGMQAVAELGVLSPFLEVGITKQDIRDLSRELDIPIWSKPSFACLASRFAYGCRITPELLARVGAAEQAFLDAGFAQVRVRVHENGALARVEVLPAEIARALDYLARGGSQHLHELGFSHVSLDMDGYRTGSMNE